MMFLLSGLELFFLECPKPLQVFPNALYSLSEVSFSCAEFSYE